MNNIGTTLIRITACIALLSMLTACEAPPQPTSSYDQAGNVPCDPGYVNVGGVTQGPFGDYVTCYTSPPSGYDWVTNGNTVVGWEGPFGSSGTF